MSLKNKEASKTKIVIVEDESIVAKDIESSLNKLNYNIVGIASDAEKAVMLAKEKNPDIILMDIMLKGNKTGIDAAKKINKENNIPIVYLTAYADEATLKKAKETEPYGYILKPFKDTVLHATIETTIHRHLKTNDLKKERDLLIEIAEKKNNDNHTLFIKSKSQKIKLKTQDILYVEALKDYVNIYTIKSRHTIHSTMKEFESKLPSCHFIRVHRSYIVRIDKIVSVEFSLLFLEGDTQVKIPIGGSYKEQLKKKLNLV